MLAIFYLPDNLLYLQHKPYYSNLSDMKHQVQKNVVGVPVSSSVYSNKRSSGNLVTDHNLAIKCYNPPAKTNSKFSHSKYSSIVL